MPDIYHYDKNNKLTGITSARLDVRETSVQGTEVYLLPRNSTFTCVPNVALEQDYFWFYVNNEWVSQYVEPPEEMIDYIEEPI